MKAAKKEKNVREKRRGKKKKRKKNKKNGEIFGLVDSKKNILSYKNKVGRSAKFTNDKKRKR